MHFTVKASAVLSVAASFTAPVSATWVQQCYSRLFDQRADPILQPGKVAYHTHVIAGGNGFNFTMDYAAARASTCSSCAIKEDLSNYWTPKMYYHAQNGSFITVPIEGDDVEGNMGGMAIYYLHRPGPDNDPIVPFPKGFRMIAGNAMKRTTGTDFASLAVNHRCIGTDFQSNALPNQNCPGGVRVQVTFPGCWDGKNVDSKDHQSHVAYPKDGNFDGGRCPSTHPKHIMTLFFEVTYRTDQFDDMWYDGKQPFVFANGDPTGYGFHGDFVNGWDIPTLQKAITNCVDGATSCPDQTFTYFDKDETQSCKLPNRIDEQVNGILPKLAGCNPITTDAASAAKAYANCKDKTAIGLPSTADDVGGYKYIGCGTDPIMDGGRTLTGPSQTDTKMTPEMCVSFCKGQGYTYAGTEYGTECYCGNTLLSARAPRAGIFGNCNMRCGGNAEVMCGGSQALSLYQNPIKKTSKRHLHKRYAGHKGGLHPNPKIPNRGDQPLLRRDAEADAEPGRSGGYHPDPKQPSRKDQPVKREAGRAGGFHPDPKNPNRHDQPLKRHAGRSGGYHPDHKNPNRKTQPVRRDAEAEAEPGRSGGFHLDPKHPNRKDQPMRREADADPGRTGGYHPDPKHPNRNDQPVRRGADAEPGRSGGYHPEPKHPNRHDQPVRREADPEPGRSGGYHPNPQNPNRKDQPVRREADPEPGRSGGYHLDPKRPNRHDQPVKRDAEAEAGRSGGYHPNPKQSNVHDRPMRRDADAGRSGGYHPDPKNPSRKSQPVRREAEAEAGRSGGYHPDSEHPNHRDQPVRREAEPGRGGGYHPDPKHPSVHEQPVKRKAEAGRGGGHSPDPKHPNMHDQPVRREADAGRSGGYRPDSQHPNIHNQPV